MAIITITEVQAITQVTYSGSTNPTSTQVGTWITEVETWLEEWTGIKFTEQTATAEKHDGDGTPYILTDYYPITSITSLVVDNATLTADSDYWLLDATAGMIECKVAPLKRVEGSTEGHSNSVITYKYGRTTVAQNIKELAATIVALRAINAATLASNPAGSIKSYSDGDVSITYSETDASTTELLRRYEELKLQTPRRTVMKVGGV